MSSVFKFIDVCICLVWLCFDFGLPVWAQSAGDLYRGPAEGKTEVARQQLLREIRLIQRLMASIIETESQHRSHRIDRKSLLSDEIFLRIFHAYNSFVQTALDEQRIFLSEAVVLERIFYYWATVMDEWRVGRGIPVFVTPKYVFWVGWHHPASWWRLIVTSRTGKPEYPSHTYLSWSSRSPFRMFLRLRHAFTLFQEAVELDQFPSTQVQNFFGNGPRERLLRQLQKFREQTLVRRKDWRGLSPHEIDFLSPRLVQVLLRAHADRNAALNSGAVRIRQAVEDEIEHVFDFQNTATAFRELMRRKLQGPPNVAHDLIADLETAELVDWLQLQGHGGGKPLVYDMDSLSEEGALIFRELLRQPRWDVDTLTPFVHRFLRTYHVL